MNSIKHLLVDLSEAVSWETFHDAFCQQLNFPGYYGRNMDAWIDCMSDLLRSGETLVLSLKGASELKLRYPGMLETLNECVAFINYREVQSGVHAVLALAYAM